MLPSVFAIAVNTFRESVRGKILYLTLFFAVLITIISSVFGLVTIGDRVRVIKDFGLMSISLFSVAFVVIAGGSFLAQELNRKTVFNILAKPVDRWQFLVGKFLGMSLTAAILVLLTGAALSVYTALFEGHFDTMLLLAYGFSILEAIIVAACVIFFSSIVVTPVLSGLFAFGVFLAGRAAPSILDLANNEQVNPTTSALLSALYNVLPQFHQFVIANSVVYGDPVAPERILWCLCYTLGYSGLLLTIASLFFSRREFN
jgi:Cu-processing system permease protein